MMNEKIFQVINVRWQGKGESVAFEDTQTNQVYFAENQEECERIVELLNEQQFIIEELKTHNLQHFLEWLVIKGYVTDESMKDINNVIDCVNKFKEYLTPELDKFKEWLEVLEDE